MADWPLRSTSRICVLARQHVLLPAMTAKEVKAAPVEGEEGEEAAEEDVVGGEEGEAKEEEGVEAAVAAEDEEDLQRQQTQMQTLTWLQSSLPSASLSTPRSPSLTSAMVSVGFLSLTLSRQAGPPTNIADHVIGSPLVFADKAYADKAWVPYKEIPALRSSPNIKTVHGSVTSVDMAGKTAVIKAAAAAGGSSSTVDFDFIIVTAGLRRAFPVVPQSPDKVAYLKEVTPHIEAVSTGEDGVLVVGGGAVGIEMAAELKLAQPHVKVTLAHSRNRLLSSEPLPDNLAEKTLDILKENGVEVLLEHRLQETRELEGGAKEVVFTNGHTLRVNAVVVAISKSIPSTSFLPAEALNEEGLIKIQPK